jgi:PAS domain S-box-containing protein
MKRGAILMNDAKERHKTDLNPDGSGAAVPAPDYRLLFDSAPDPCLVLDPKLRIVAANDAYLRATMTTRQEILGRGIFEVFPDNPAESDAKSVRNQADSLNRVLANRVPDTLAVLRYDIRKPEHDGGGFEERYWSTINTPVLGADGEISYIIHRVADVTGFIQLKQIGVEEDKLSQEMQNRAVQMEADIYARSQEVAEANLKLKLANEELERQKEKLRESEEKFAKAFQTAPTLISISSLAKGRYLDVNDEFVKTLEFERDEIIGHSSLDLDIWETPGDREQVVRMLRENKKVRNFETRLRSKGGSIITGLLSTEIIEIEGEECLLTITRDITELRKAEEERTRLVLIVESSVDAIIGKTLEGTITSWNRGAEAIYGYSAREVIGENISILAPPEYPDEIPRILERLKRGERIERLETKRRRKDGRLIEVSLTISPITDKNNAIVGASTIARDITDRKQAEEEIGRLNADLAARAAELETANRDLEAFNYTVAHDLRQPLNVISSYCQAIDIMCGDQLQKECKDYVQGAYDGTLRMNRLIEALLDFSRLARVEPRRETVNLSALAHEVAQELRRAEPERRVDFRIAEDIAGTGDANLLRVVLDNLLGNAWKYTDMREVAVIEFNVDDSNGKPVYLVRDNGPGFDMADADQLFAPFQRLPGAGERRGFGIGLATVARIIERHGGKVWAEGVPDKGATFYFTLSTD